MTALVHSQTRRRPLTYGKKSSRLPQQHGFTPDSEALGQLTPTNTPSKLRKLGHTPAHESSLNQPSATQDGNPAVFDIPSSEDDAPSPTPRAHRESASKSRRHAKTKPLVRRITPPSPTLHVSRTSSADSRKRKRSDSLSNQSRQSLSSVDTDAQINKQLQQELAAAEVRLSWEFDHPLQERPTGSTASNAGPMTDVFSTFTGPKTHEKPRKDRRGAKQSRGSGSFPKTAPRLDGSSPTRRIGDVPQSKFHEAPQTPPRRSSSDIAGHLAHTPPDSGSSPCSPLSTSRAVTTPRQARLWDTLLREGQESVPLKKMDTLNLRPTLQENNPKPPRLRLIDSLVAVAESSPGLADESRDDDPITVDMNSDPSSINQAPEALPDSQLAPVATLGPRITYAQQRSHLSEKTGNIESLLNHSLDNGANSGIKMSANVGLNSQSLGNDAEEEQEGNGQMRSIHELRASGNNRRFDHEIGKLLEDISDTRKSALSGKRSALLELVEKFADPAFKNRFLQSACSDQLLDACHSEKDSITGTAVAAVVILILATSQGQPSTRIPQASRALRTLQDMLCTSRDIRAIARDRQTNMSKFAQGTVIDFEQTIKKSSVWTGRKPKLITPRLMALKALDLLVRMNHETGDTDTLVDRQTVLVLVSIMSQSCDSVGKLTKTANEDHWLHLELSTSILESCSIVPVSSTGSLWTEEVLSSLIDCMGSALSLTLPEAQTIQPLLLRLSLNLANSNELTSESFAKSTFICKVAALVTSGFRLLETEAIDERQQHDFDRLLLALGTLFNLAEMSNTARQLVIDECGSDLDEMVHIFSNSRSKYAEADSMEASQMNVALGYLAVLLGHLCRNWEVKRRIQSKLPGCRLVPLAEAIDEFITYHKEVDQREGASEVWAVFTSRLQVVADLVKELDAEQR